MSRMDKIRSFSAPTLPTPVVQFIPTDAIERAALYADYYRRGVSMPTYSAFDRKNLRKRDMMVLSEPLVFAFEYCGHSYTISFSEGVCFDGASVPVWAVFGNVSKFNQYVLLAALVHDALFALKLVPFEDANNVFSGILREQGIPKFALARYMLGVRSPVGRSLYRQSEPRTNWLKGFVTFARS